MGDKLGPIKLDEPRVAAREFTERGSSDQAKALASKRLKPKRARPRRLGVDPWELEAEALAQWLAHVAAMPDLVEGDEQPVVSPLSSTRAGLDVSAELGRRIEQRAAAGGRPLDPAWRRPFEAVLGRDLGDVRLHTDPVARELVEDTGAEALARGRDIFVARSPSPSSAADRELVAHELVHVLQQDGDRTHTAEVVQPAFGEVPSEVLGPKVDILIALHFGAAVMQRLRRIDSQRRRGRGARPSDAELRQLQWFQDLRDAVEVAEGMAGAPDVSHVENALRHQTEDGESSPGTIRTTYGSADAGTTSHPVQNAAAGLLADYLRLSGEPGRAADVVMDFPWSRTAIPLASVRMALFDHSRFRAQVSTGTRIASMQKPDVAGTWPNELVAIVDQFLLHAPPIDESATDPRAVLAEQLLADVGDLPHYQEAGSPLSSLSSRSTLVPNELVRIGWGLFKTQRATLGRALQSVATQTRQDARDVDAISAWMGAVGRIRRALGQLRSSRGVIDRRLARELTPTIREHVQFWRDALERAGGTHPGIPAVDDDEAEAEAEAAEPETEEPETEDETSEADSTTQTLRRERAAFLEQVFGGAHPSIATALRDVAAELAGAAEDFFVLALGGVSTSARAEMSPRQIFAGLDSSAPAFALRIRQDMAPAVATMATEARAAGDQDRASILSAIGVELAVLQNDLTELVVPEPAPATPAPESSAGEEAEGGEAEQADPAAPALAANRWLIERIEGRRLVASRLLVLSRAALRLPREPSEAQAAAEQQALTAAQRMRVPAGESWDRTRLAAQRALRGEHAQVSILVLRDPYEQSEDSSIARMDRETNADSIVGGSNPAMRVRDLIELLHIYRRNELTAALWQAIDNARDRARPEHEDGPRTIDDLWLVSEAANVVEGRQDSETGELETNAMPRRYASPRALWQPYAEDERNFSDIVARDSLTIVLSRQHQAWGRRVLVNDTPPDSAGEVEIFAWSIPPYQTLLAPLYNQPIVRGLMAVSDDDVEQAVERTALDPDAISDFILELHEIGRGIEASPVPDRFMQRYRAATIRAERLAMVDTRHGELMEHMQSREREASLNRLHHAQRMATTTDRAVVREAIEDEIEAGASQARSALALRHVLAMIEGFRAAVLPAREEEQLWQMSALVYEVLDPLLELMDSSVFTQVYDDESHFLLGEVSAALGSLRRARPRTRGDRPRPIARTRIDQHAEGILNRRTRAELRADYAEIRQRIRDARLVMLNRMNPWQRAITGSRSSHMLRSHAIGGREVMALPAARQYNEDNPDATRASEVISLGGPLRIRVAEILQDFTFIPGMGDRSRAQQEGTGQHARYHHAVVYLGVAASNMEELENLAWAAREDPRADPPAAAGSSNDELVHIELLNGPEVIRCFPIRANDFGSRRAGLNWFAQVIHNQAIGEHFGQLADTIEGFGEGMLFLISLYPPAGAVLTAAEVLNFIHTLNTDPEFQQQLETLATEPMTVLDEFTQRLTSQFEIGNLFDLLMNGNFDAPDFASSTGGRRGRPFGGRRIARIFTRLRRIGAVVAVRLEAFQEAVQGPVRRIEAELAENARLASILHSVAGEVEDLSDPLAIVLRHPIAGPFYEAYALYRRFGRGAETFATIREPIDNLARDLETGLQAMRSFELPANPIPLDLALNGLLELALLVARRAGRYGKAAAVIGEILRAGAQEVGIYGPFLTAMGDMLRGTWTDPNVHWQRHVVPALADPLGQTTRHAAEQITEVILATPLISDYLAADRFEATTQSSGSANVTANEAHDEMFENNERVSAMVPAADAEEVPVGPIPASVITSLPEGAFPTAAEGEGEGEGEGAGGESGYPRSHAECQTGSASASPSPTPAGVRPAAMPPARPVGSMSRGAPLGGGLRRDVQRRFGHDFGHVRLHRGSHAAALTHRAGADALTLGSHVFMRPDLSPTSGRGAKVFDHELGHVLQKRGPRPLGLRHRPSLQAKAGAGGAGIRWRPSEERAADAMAGRARHNRDSRPIAVEGRHDEGASPRIRAELIETFLRRISSPGAGASLAETVERAHRRRGIADIDDNVQTAGHHLWSRVRAVIVDGGFTTPDHFRGSRQLIKEHLIERIGTLPESGPSAGSVPAASRVIDHLAARRQDEVPRPAGSRRSSGGGRSGRGASSGSGGDEQRHRLDGAGFLNDLGLYLAARSGIVLDIRGPRNLNDQLTSSSRPNVRIRLAVNHIELFFINDRPNTRGGAIWQRAINRTWDNPSNADPYRMAVKAVLRRRFGSDPPETTHRADAGRRRSGGSGGDSGEGGESSTDTGLGEGAFQAIWDRSANDVEFDDAFKEVVAAEMNPPQLDAQYMPPHDIYTGKRDDRYRATAPAGEGGERGPQTAEQSRRAAERQLSTEGFSDESRRVRASKNAIHIGTHAELTSGFQLTENKRNSHHIVQFLLAEYFRNDKTFKPFPNLRSRDYPGVVKAGSDVDKIRNLHTNATADADDTIMVGRTFAGRGGAMPAILISQRAHQNAGLHVTPRPDETGSSSQGFAIHRKFEDELASALPITSEDPVDADRYLTDHSSDRATSLALNLAVKRTYRWLWQDQMYNDLVGDMPRIEAQHYLAQFRDRPGASGDGPTGPQRLAALHDDNAPEEDEIAGDIETVARYAASTVVERLQGLGWYLPSGSG